MSGLVGGSAAAWLEARRPALNDRFEKARRRWPSLDPDDVLLRLSTILPTIAGDEPESARLCDVVYDLVLLHAGRGAFARAPGLQPLLELTFPGLRRWLLLSPGQLCTSLSNAVENLGPAGELWAATFPKVAATLEPRPEAIQPLLDAGAVLAWRLGEARLRTRALAVARGLPPATLEAALGMPAAALDALTRDGWTRPGEVFHGWRRVGTLGGFSGFGGPFDQPPRVLDGGDPHTFFVASGDRHYRVDADQFGQHVSAVPDPNLSTRAPKKQGLLGSLLGSKEERAEADGSFYLADGVVRIPEAAGIESWTRRGHVIVTARRDSHTLAVYAREAVGLGSALAR